MTQDLSLILEKSVFMVASVKHQSVATFGHIRRGWRIGGGDIDLSLCNRAIEKYKESHILFAYIRKIRPCNIQRFFTAVKITIFG